jgi:hypothetical protein
MPCDRFTLNDSGKAIVEEKIKLDCIELQGERYLADKKFLDGLKEYTLENLKGNPIYTVVGTNKENNWGLTAEIEDTGRLEKFLEEYSNQSQ